MINEYDTHPFLTANPNTHPGQGAQLSQAGLGRLAGGLASAPSRAGQAVNMLVVLGAG